MDTSQPGTIHDAFFKRLMGDPATAGEFLQERLPPAVSALMTRKPPELQTGSFVAVELSQHHADLVYRTQTTDGKASLYLLLEHKSRADGMVDFQLLRYQVRLWEKAMKEGEGSHLPPVIPLIVYHGARPWLTSSAFRGPLRKVAEPLRPYLPATQYVLADLSQIEDAALSRNVRTRSFLMAMKYVQRRDILKRLETILSEVQNLETVDVVEILFYIKAARRDLDDRVVRTILDRLAPGRVEKVMADWTDRYRAEGKREGKREGKLEGKREGKLEGKAEALIAFIGGRFGRIEDSVRQRIMAADADTLDRWLDSVANAPDLDSMFGGKPAH